MKNRNKLNNCHTNKEYKVYSGAFPHLYDIECAFCKRCSICRMHEFCRPTKGKIRNWKEFRKTQYKYEN